MKTLLIVAIAAVALLLNAGGTGAAEPMDDCSHDATLPSLRACIEHAAEHGHIDSAGVARSLLAKLDAAQAALDRGQPAVAVAILEALIREVAAQAGVHIAEPHAGHLQEHARHVIHAIQPPE
jgi:hypothetical protein